MEPLEFRPRYKFFTPLSIDEIAQKLVAAASTQNQHVIMRRRHGHFVLDIANHVRHFWSPHMDVSLERESDQDQTLVRCLIGPAPTVWTLFMFFYGFFGFAAFVGLTLGLSQWTLDKPMWGFWLIPIALVGFTALYVISQQGQGLARDQMRVLKHFVDHALECDCFALAQAQNSDGPKNKM